MNYNKILVVDDSATSRMIIIRCFKIAGFTESSFFEAENGLDALTFFENKNSVDLIVTDINMPKMDGHNLIKKLKIDEETKMIPIVIISSMEEEASVVELNKMGIKGIIKKPISPVKIRETLGETL
jgi:two-component system, chemotaxis family, chemotaxis protein CheY